MNTENENPMKLLVDADVEIARLRKENRKLREALEQIKDMRFDADDWDEPGFTAVEIASNALVR
jgi:hypothetical protein